MVTNRYLDLEVTRIGKAFSEFFRRLRRRPGQSIRDYNSEYDRLHARLREVGCNLPEDCAAWLYVDRLQLGEAAELNLLASVGNTYSLPRLQQAAVIHDRGHRKPWEGGGSGKGRRPHTAHYTEADDSFGSGEEDLAHDDEDDGVSEEVAIAYATYQTAKQRYKENQKSRGFNGYGDRSDPPAATRGGEKANDKIKLMKAKSFCSGCGRRGHWRKDPECPHNQGSLQKPADKGKPADVSFCNLLPAEVYAIKHENAGLVGVTDTACAIPTGLLHLEPSQNFAKNAKPTASAPGRSTTPHSSRSWRSSSATRSSMSGLRSSTVTGSVHGFCCCTWWRPLKEPRTV